MIVFKSSPIQSKFQEEAYRMVNVIYWDVDTLKL
jgi:hypothetical protein